MSYNIFLQPLTLLDWQFTTVNAIVTSILRAQGSQVAAMTNLYGDRVNCADLITLPQAGSFTNGFFCPPGQKLAEQQDNNQCSQYFINI